MRKLAVGSLLVVALLLASWGGSSSGLGSSSADPLSVGSGPFWYMRTVGTMRMPRCLKERYVPPTFYGVCEGTVWFEAQMSLETWVGTDGTIRERTVEDWQRFVSAAGRARWLASKKRVPVPISVSQGDALDIGSGHFPPPLFDDVCCEVPPVEGPPAGTGPVDVGDGLFTYRQLLSLPTSPAALLQRIEQAQTALRHRYAETLLRWHSPGAEVIARGDLGPLPKGERSSDELLLIAHLLTSPIPAPVRLALFHAAAALPGAAVDPNARDALGRSGTKVTTSSPHWEAAQFMFDPRTGELLTGQPMNGGPPDVSNGASVVVAQSLVDSVTALPPGVPAIQGVGAPPIWPSPPAPAMETITPKLGHRSTVFTIMLAATPGERAHPAPTAWLGVGGLAGRGIHLGANNWIDPCLPSRSVRVWPTTTVRASGKLVYIYRFGPQRFHLRTWCRGRYEVGLQVTPNPIPPRYTTPPYTGQSGTSNYVEVR